MTDSEGSGEDSELYGGGSSPEIPDQTPNGTNSYHRRQLFGAPSSVVETSEDETFNSEGIEKD